MPSPAETVKDILVAEAVGDFATVGATGWVICIGKLIDVTDQRIALMDVGGLSPNPKWLLDQPSVQALVRGNRGDYSGAWTQAKKVKDTLLGIDAQDVTGGRLNGIVMLGDINTLGYDDNNRPQFSVNFRLILEPDATVETQRQAI